jgi:hypothetical protein
MRAMLFLLVGTLIASGSSAQMQFEPKPGNQSEDRQHPFKTTLPFNSHERELVYKAAAGNATSSELKTAMDICTKKCKPCHNGVKCDLECAKKTCLESQ